jgi:SEC-C motif
MAKVGRNDKCPCGSGKKHKNCCGAQSAGSSVASRVMMGVVVVMLLGAAYAGFTAMTADAGSAGPAPGKVWSAEHGHYH